MDPELEKRLRSIEERLDKNQQILVRIRRVQRSASLFRLFYWVVIILLGFGAFYFIQPYLNAITSGYGNIQNSFTDLKNFNSLLDQLKGNSPKK